MAFMFPAIMFRLESYLIAQECVRDLRLDIRLDLALEALTKDSDNREDVRADQIHVERGMGKNYERLELLGDCFLKLATTIALFTRHARSDEYEYHVDRMLMVCNQNLFRTAVDLKLNESIRSRGFSR